jgi:hypothetical protein|tara:strand:- start:43 stop:195 length:153 start_codon:yes stop_codon:yes gene_type:complete
MSDTPEQIEQQRRSIAMQIPNSEVRIEVKLSREKAMVLLDYAKVLSGLGT